MKLLVLGAYDSCNLGDGIICRCTAALIQKRFPTAEVEIRDLLRRDRRMPKAEPSPEALKKRWFYEKARSLASRAGIDRVLRNEQARVESYRTYIQSVCAEDYDAVIFAGGQLLMDRYALFLEQYVHAFAKRQIPVLFNACGVGPMDSRGIYPRLKAVLQSPSVGFLSCRDHVALINERFSPHVAARFAADPALWTGEVFGIQRNASDTVGLGMMYPWGMDVNRVVRFWRKLIVELDRRNTSWRIFTNGDPADIAFAKIVLNGSGEEKICARDTEPEGLVRTIGQFRSIISFRLHSHIVACALDIPSVAMVWDDKLPIFFDALRHKERCLTVRESPECVLSALTQAEAEGYDRQRVQDLAEASRTLLLQALEECL